MFLRLISLFFFLLVGPLWALEDISKLSEGAPQIMGKYLPETSYASFEAKRLKNARVLWLNFDLLREKGFEIPKEGLTPEFEQKVLDALAYKVPGKFDDPQNFLEAKKTWYADRYGGSGIGFNLGSGRAASSGIVQVKGVGVTPLVGKGTSFDHAHGGASLEEGIREAIWGETFNNELTLKGNRVIALIDPSTFTQWSDGGKEAQALIVREDVVRPAHFINSGNDSFASEGLLPEKQRVKNANKFLASALNSDKKGNLKEGLLKYAENMAAQYAEATSKRLYHGATSPSNIQITGGFLDYGTASSQPGWGKIKVIEHNDPFGEIKEIVTENVHSLLDSIKENSSPEERKLLPTKEELSKIFAKTYEEKLRLGIIKQTGIPEETINAIRANHPQIFKKFSELLDEVSTSGTHEMMVDKAMPERTATNNMREALLKASASDILSEEKILEAIKGDILNATLRERFAHEYSKFLKLAFDEAHLQGVSLESFRRLIFENSKRINRPLEFLYRASLMDISRNLVDSYQHTKDRAALWEALDTMIHDSKTTQKNISSYEVVLKEKTNHVSGLRERTIFSAKEGKEFHEVFVPLSEGKAEFYGHTLSSDEIKKGQIRYSTDDWKSFKEIKASSHDGGVSFKIPLKENDRHLEFVLRSEDSSTWWKKGNENIKVALTPKFNCDPESLLKALFQ